MSLSPSRLEKLLFEDDHIKLISRYFSLVLTSSSQRMEKIARQWTSDILTPTDETWSEVVGALLPSVISARDKIIQFNFMHRIYYTPACMNKMGRVDSPECHRCHTEEGDDFLMIWKCPQVTRFWKTILMFLEDRLAILNIYSPVRCLLGDFGEEDLSSNEKTLLNIVFFMLRKSQHSNGKTLYSLLYNSG